MSKLECEVERLATQVLPLSMLASFLSLPLSSKITGLAFFAHVGGDDRMAEHIRTLRAILPGER